MKAYICRKQQNEDTAEDLTETEQEATPTSSDNFSLARAVHDWNHALEIATDRIWESETPLLQMVRRK